MGGGCCWWLQNLDNGRATSKLLISIVYKKSSTSIYRNAFQLKGSNGMQKYLIVVLCIISLMIISCSSSQASSNSLPDGYLATDSISVAFIQFTEKHNQLAGHMQGIGETNNVPPQTKSYNYSFTGTQDGSSITITFSVFWTSTSFTGMASGNIITLDLPQSNGHIVSRTFNGASIQQYNQAVDALRKQVNQQDQQYYGAQIAAYNAQATATAQQDEQKAMSNANYHLSNALSTLKSDSSTLASFSETSTLSGYANDWRAMQNDYTTEQNTSQAGCGASSTNYKYHLRNVG